MIIDPLIGIFEGLEFVLNYAALDSLSSIETKPTVADRQNFAANLQKIVATWHEEVSIETSGDEANVLVISVKGLTKGDTSYTQHLADRYKSKLKKLGFNRIEFYNRKRVGSVLRFILQLTFTGERKLIQSYDLF
jgi:hypothetical protein